MEQLTANTAYTASAATAMCPPPPSAAETYPIGARLRALHPTDYVFLFLTWHRLGFDEERLRQYCRFPCQVGGEGAVRGGAEVCGEVPGGAGPRFCAVVRSCPQGTLVLANQCCMFCVACRSSCVPTRLESSKSCRWRACAASTSTTMPCWTSAHSPLQTPLVRNQAGHVPND